MGYYRIRECFGFMLPYVVFWVDSEGEEYLESESLHQSDAYDYIAEQDWTGKVEYIKV